MLKFLKQVFCSHNFQKEYGYGFTKKGLGGYQYFCCKKCGKIPPIMLNFEKE